MGVACRSALCELKKKRAQRAQNIVKNVVAGKKLRKVKKTE